MNVIFSCMFSWNSVLVPYSIMVLSNAIVNFCAAGALVPIYCVPPDLIVCSR